jgi:hypothetical protein
MEGATPPEANEQLVNGNSIPSEENRDDTEDYIGLLLYDTQKATEEGSWTSSLHFLFDQ